jgi:hypothetical protein
MLSATLQVCLNNANNIDVLSATLQVCLNNTHYTRVKRHPTSVSQ